jgi:spore maturation protein CgeB
MNILFYDMGSYTYKEFATALMQANHTIKTVYYHFKDVFHDDFFCERISDYLSEKNYDLVISINFFPLLAQMCHERDIRYVSWSYDSPLQEAFKPYYTYPTNYIFLFDRDEVEELRTEGFDRIFHLPLAVNTETLDNILASDKYTQKYKADVSFVGHIYESPLETLLSPCSDYIKGYIEGIIQAQLRIYGYNFVDSVITDEILNAVNEAFRSLGQVNTVLNKKGLSYAVNAQLTHLERHFLIEQMGEYYDMKFYSTKKAKFESGVIQPGPVKYFTEMPFVFRHSRLNLNPTLRSIKSGIPLRALDIMGSKGLLFSNYQPELAEYFTDGQDVVMYESMEDAFAKAGYYMEHEDICTKIAANGYRIVKESFTYTERLRQMLEIVQAY